MDREELKLFYKINPEAAINYTVKAFNELENRIKVLEARLNKNSNNSSKPPSSDGYNKPNKKNNSRKKSEKKPGGQKGHKGSTLNFSENPDEIIQHYPEQCNNCPKLKFCKQNFKIEKRQVKDIVKPEMKTTEYQIFSGQCPHSGSSINGFFPKDVNSPVSYGPLIQTFVVLAKDYQFVPYERTCEFLHDVFGIKISQGTIANIEKRVAGNLTDYYDNLKNYAKQSELLHVDETGIRVENVLNWLHVYSTDSFTYYSNHKNRGTKAIEDIGILLQFTGFLCHDFWASYLKLDCNHSMCNAHLLRELTAMVDLYGETWAEKLAKLLLDIKRKVDSNIDGVLNEKMFKKYKQDWLDILENAIKLHPTPERKPGQRGRIKKGKARCLLDRLYNHVDEILCFAKIRIAPFDNNQAERDLRMIKTKLKISGSFRSTRGADVFCKIRSYISTLKKQGKNIFEGIQFAVNSKPILVPE
jgi:transposase